MKERLPEDSKKAADWKDFLRVIAPQYINRNTEVIISEKDQTISFTIGTTEIDACKEHFAQVLRDSDSFNKQLSYLTQSSVSSRSSSSSFASMPSQIPQITTIEEAKLLMQKLFGIEVMQGFNPTNINFNTRFTYYKDGVLYSEQRSLSTHRGKMFAAEAPLSQNFLCAYFHNVGVDSLRSIIAEQSGPLPIPSDELLEAERGEGFVQTCFGIVETQEKPGAERYIQMYFDVARFLHLLYAPELHCEIQQDESKTSVTLSLSHLLLYVKQLSSHGLLFSVTLEHGRVNAHPLLLPHKEIVARPLAIFIVLDDSGSMIPYRKGVFDSVIPFIKRVAAVTPDAEIHLTLFSVPGQEVRIKQKAIEFDFKIFEGDSADRRTALFDALATPLSAINQQLNSHNNLLVIFTDGIDNESHKTCGQILKEIGEIKDAVVRNGAPPPVIYSIGCGKVDINVLKPLGDSVGNDGYIELKNVAEFAEIIENIKDFEYRRVLTEFIIESNRPAEEHTIQVPLHGNPHIVRNVTIPLSDKPVKVDCTTLTRGQELARQQITLQITRTQAQEVMEGYAQSIEALYLDPNVQPVFKIAKLNALRGDIDTFCAKAPQAVVLSLAEEAHRKINEYVSVLQRYQDNEKTANVSSSSSLVPAIASLGNPAYSSPPVVSATKPAEAERKTTLNL